MNPYHFQAEEREVVFLRDLDEDTEAVLKFSVADARDLVAYLEMAIAEAEHFIRMEKEELLANLRTAVETLEDELAA